MNTMTFLGTGSAFNHKHGNNVGLFKFNRTNLLLDCGHTLPAMLDKTTIRTCDIKNIFITHVHGDHIGGLEELVWKNRYLYNGFKPNLFIPVGFQERLKSYLNSTLRFTGEAICELEDHFNIYIVDSTFTINDYTFTIKEVEHIKDAKSYMLIGENFIFTGDTQFIDWTQYDLSQIEYIFHDTQLAKYENNVHSTLPDMLNLPFEIRRKIYCMHYGENIDDFKDQIYKNDMKIVFPYGTINLV